MNPPTPGSNGGWPLRTWLLTLALALLFAASAAAAPQVVSPEVHPDRTVTFRVAAPNAAEVKLNLEGAPARALVKDAAGIWSVTTPPLEPDFYNYSFQIDGVLTADSNNPVLRSNLIWLSNVVHVPGPSTLSWEWRDVPHGEIHHHFYRSAICGDDRDYLVYTPPGYNPGRAEPYPTLFLLHGFSDDATAWSTVGRANVILDNLIAEGRAKPMVVVMPLGYGDLSIIAKARAGNGAMKSGGYPLMARNGRLFQEALIREVLPRVSREYHLSPDRVNRAIAGLSMGAGESLQTGLAHPELFAWVGAFSTGGLSPDIPADFAGISPAKAASLKLLFMACGKDDGFYHFNQQLRAYFTAQRIAHTDLTTPMAHVWMVWRRNLTTFAPLLFR